MYGPVNAGVSFENRIQYDTRILINSRPLFATINRKCDFADSMRREAIELLFRCAWTMARLEC